MTDNILFNPFAPQIEIEEITITDEELEKAIADDEAERMLEAEYEEHYAED